MAQIWMDAENAGVQVFPRSSKKVRHLSLLNNNAPLQSGKKNVLSSLDNVINNKNHITPLKGTNTNQNWPKSCAPKVSLCKETLQKQMRKQLAKELPPLQDVDGDVEPEIVAYSKDLYAKSADPNVDFDLFDCMDFPSAKCLSNCHQPASHNWQEDSLLSEDLMNKLLNYSPAFEKDAVNDDVDFPLYPDDELELNSFQYDDIDNEDTLPDLLGDAKPPLPTLFDIDLDLF